MCPVRTREELARPKGFEPLTFGSGDRRSIQLSYERAVGKLAGIMPQVGTGALSSRSLAVVEGGTP